MAINKNEMKIIIKKEDKMKRNKLPQTVSIVISLALTFSMSAATFASDIGSPDPDVIKGLYPGKAYSPYARRRIR